MVIAVLYPIKDVIGDAVDARMRDGSLLQWNFVVPWLLAIGCLFNWSSCFGGFRTLGEYVG